jgi:hypothetical protein
MRIGWLVVSLLAAAGDLAAQGQDPPSGRWA